MTTYYLAPDPCQSTFFIPGGNTPGNGVKVFTYATGTTTKVSVAKDVAGAALHTNPIILDSGGNLPSASSMYIEAGVEIDVVYAPSNDTDPPASAYKTISNVLGVPPQNTSTSQWVDVASPVFVNTNAFRVSGDQTTELHVGRRIKTTNTGGTVYSRVTSTAFGTSTTVGVVNDSGSIDSGLSTAAYGLLSSDNNAVPLLTDFYPTLRSSTAVHTQSHNIQAYTSSHTITWPDKSFTVSDAALQSIIKQKIQSTTTANNTTMVADNDLSVSLSANTQYSIDVEAYLQSGALAQTGFKVGFVYPDDTGTVVFNSLSINSTYSYQTAWNNTTASHAVPAGLSGATATKLEMSGVVSTGTSTGTFGVTFAQSTASSTALSMGYGSVMSVQKLT